jgi:frataxin
MQMRTSRKNRAIYLPSGLLHAIRVSGDNAMMNEHKFHAIADATLMHIFDRMEDAFERGDFEELDFEEDGILKIETNQGHVFIVSKHAPSCQLWLASPISGGSHYSYNETEEVWQLADGSTLKERLMEEIASTAHVRVIL